MKNKYIISLFIILIACNTKKPEPTIHRGELLPGFKLLLVDSITYFNTATVPSGRPVVFFYFSPRCPYSRSQMQNIIDNITELKTIQFIVFTTYPFDEMESFYKKYKLDKYPNIVTGVDFSNFFMAYFKTKGVPYLALYSRQHRLTDAYWGQISISKIKQITSS